VATRPAIAPKEKDGIDLGAAVTFGTSLLPHDQMRATMQQAVSALQGVTGSYTLGAVMEQQERQEEQRRERLLSSLDTEEDMLQGVDSIEAELRAGAHIEELVSIIDDLEEGTLRLTQPLVNGVTVLMRELRDMAPYLPAYMIDEIKELSFPLRDMIAAYARTVQVV